MREFDDVHKLIEEESQNPFEREALNDLVSLLAEGPLGALPEDAFRDQLRRTLLAEAATPRRLVRPWYRTPLAMSAAAAVVVGLAAGTTFWGLQYGRTNTAPQATTLAANAGSGSPDDTNKTAPNAPEGTMGLASATQEPGVSGAGVASPQPSLTAPSGGASSRAMVRPAQRDGSMVRVEPGTATFTLEASLPAARTDLPVYHMVQLSLVPADVQAVAGRLDLSGDVQQGFGHLWLGTPLAGQDAPVEGLPPYKHAGRWLVASPDWGSGWSYLYRDDTPTPGSGSPAVTLTEAERAFRFFLEKAGMPGADEAGMIVRPEENGSYWGDMRLRLADTDVVDAGGALRLDASGRVIYASWPALSLTQAGSRPVQSPEQALTALRSMPFQWYKGGPKLTVTRVALVYRWPLMTSPGAEADLEPAYKFSVRDADGNQSVLYVAAWR